MGHSLNTPVSRLCARVQTPRTRDQVVLTKDHLIDLKYFQKKKKLRVSILTESIIFNCGYACICSKHAHLCTCMLYICGGQKSFSVFSLICFLSSSSINLFVHSFIFKTGSLTESGAK